MQTPKATDIQAFLAEVFPQIDSQFHIESVTEQGALVRMPRHEKHLRPGGTVSGPAMFALADVSMYIALLGRIGLEALTVTTNCSIDFLRKPSAEADMLCDVTILKLGKTLAVGNARLFSEGMEQPVATATLTYAIPPKRD